MQSLRSKEQEKQEELREKPYFRSIFGKIALYADGVCSNCFRRTHNVQDMRRTKRKVNTSLSNNISDKVFHPVRETTELEYIKGDTPSEPKRVCKCGAVDNSTEVRPIDPFRTFDRANKLEARLSEWGLDYDNLTFRNTLAEATRKCQFDDEGNLIEGITNIDFCMAVKASTDKDYSEFVQEAYDSDEFSFGSEQSLEKPDIDPDSYNRQEWDDRADIISPQRYGPTTTEEEVF